MTIQIPASGKVVFGGQSRVIMRPSQTPLTAVGGNVVDITVDEVVYRTHTFTSSGILTVTSATNNIATVEYLVVGGGGGGGTSARAGGGGAGGYRAGNISLNVGDYTIAVGAGGISNTVGENSSIGYSPTGPYIIVSNGGGSGGNGMPGVPGGAGGSGGGGGSSNNPNSPFGTAGSGIPGEGFPGGAGARNNPAGGGGGGAGGSGDPYVTATGGIGVYNSISGGPVLYAQGGQGGSSSAGPSSSGFGGGGNGSSGGSGIVIIRYRIT